MVCPYCGIHTDPIKNYYDIVPDQEGEWRVFVQTCTNCKKNTLDLETGPREWNGRSAVLNPESSHRVYPKSSTRRVPEEVPTEFAEDFHEAALVLADSPKASAALSRRCLQHVLREKAGVKKGTLYKEIQEVIDSSEVPSHLTADLDAVRQVGNFAAHPIKSESTGEVVPVEPQEAEWNLEVLESLFDHYFVKPAIQARRRDALNAKLADAKKPELNSPN